MLTGYITSSRCDVHFTLPDSLCRPQPVVRFILENIIGVQSVVFFLLKIKKIIIKSSCFVAKAELPARTDAL